MLATWRHRPRRNRARKYTSPTLRTKRNLEGSFSKSTIVSRSTIDVWISSAVSAYGNLSLKVIRAGSNATSWELRDVDSYAVPLSSVFQKAAAHCPLISIHREVMAGAPCITGTRIPVYMILDAIEYYGTLEGVKHSYPQLTIQQIRGAVIFAKLVVECPIEHETPAASR